tara:strand:- start:13571 stop:16588 length:3018 start_codon:yes stop_codon:yes gene_type:complete
MSQIKIKIIVNRGLLVLTFLLYSTLISSQKPQGKISKEELRGFVTDQEGMPLSGVIIELQKKQEVVNTDNNGAFIVQFSPSDILVCRYKNFKTEKKILTGETKELTIVMRPLLLENDLTDVAFGAYPKRALTGAISQIDADVVKKNAVNTIEQALNGTLSGLHSVKDGGENMGASNYQFYLRGVATTGNKSALILVDGIDANIDLLDPKEIESVTVLKDATELSMYGVRGANGVILIKTKRGDKFDNYINVEIRTGIQKPNFITDKLNAQQYTTLYNEAIVNDGGSPVFNTPDNSDAYHFPDTDFPDLFLRNDAQHIYQNLNFSTGGGNDIAQYYCLVGYMKQDGLFAVPINFGNVNQAGHERYNFRTNIDINLGKGFKLQTNIAAIIDDKRSPWLGSGTNVNNANSTLFNRIMTTPANAYPLVNPDGSLGGTSEYQNNILGVLQAGNRVETTRQLTVKTKLSKDLGTLIKGLSANVVYSFENYDSYYQGRYTSFAVYQLDQDDTYIKYGVDDTKTSNSGGQLNNYYKDITVMAGLDYDRTIGHHQITGALIANQYTSRISGDNPDYKWLGTSARALYGYKNRYYAQLTGAYQGSNSFASGKRYGFFPALGLSWVVSEERFLQSSNIIDYLKVRASHGLVGNHLGNARYLHRQTYIKGNGYGFGNPNGSFPGTYAGTLGSFNASWEKSLKTNVGFDLNMFANTLTLSADYFYENRKNILVPQGNVVPDLIGIELPLYNSGNITNKGIELQLNYTKKIGGALFSIGGNTTIAKNNVEDLKEVAYSKGEEYRYRKGNPVDAYFGLVADGIYSNQTEIDADALVSSFGTLAPGDIKYLDLNADGVINAADKKAIGNTLPEIIYGMHLGVEFKGFDLYCFAEGTSKFTSHIVPNQFSTYAYNNRWTNATAAFSPAYPKVSLESTHNQQTSTFWQEKGNVFRFSTLELGYSLPQNVVRSMSLSNLRLFINIDNMFSTANSKENRDFEAVNAGYSDYPMLKTYLLGLSLNL